MGFRRCACIVRFAFAVLGVRASLNVRQLLELVFGLSRAGEVPDSSEPICLALLTLERLGALPDGLYVKPL